MLTWCERLEDRVLLSGVGNSASIGALQGTYTGTLHVNAGGATRHAMSMSFASDGAWPISGSLNAAGIGTFHFAGSSDGKAARLVFAADAPGAGEIVVRPRPPSTLRGTFTENIGARTLHGTFALAAGTVATGGGSAVRLGKIRASQPNLTGTYQSASSSSPSVSLTLSGESLSGLVAGNLAVGAQTFSTTGIVRGNELDLVLAGGGTATFTRSGASIRGRIHMGTDNITVLLVNHGAKTHTSRAGGSNGTASSGNTTSASSGSSASLSGTTGPTVSSSNASTSLVVSGLGEFVNIGSLTAFGSGASNPFGNLNNITTATPTSSTTIGVPGTGSTGVIASGGTLPSSGNTNGSPTAGSGFTTGVGASPPIGSTTTVPGTSSGVVGSVPVAPTSNPASGGDLYGTPIYGTGSPGFQ